MKETIGSKAMKKRDMDLFIVINFHFESKKGMYAVEKKGA